MEKLYPSLTAFKPSEALYTRKPSYFHKRQVVLLNKENIQKCYSVGERARLTSYAHEEMNIKTRAVRKNDALVSRFRNKKKHINKSDCVEHKRVIDNKNSERLVVSNKNLLQGYRFFEGADIKNAISKKAKPSHIYKDKVALVELNKLPVVINLQDRT